MEDPTKTQERLTIVLKVLSGQLNVTQAAEVLCISRKSYYEWQERALAGMRDALTDRPAGRPAMPVDAEKEQLRDQVEDLSNQLTLAQKAIEVKNILAAYAAQQKLLLNDTGVSGKKKRTRKRP
jgi:transposase